MTALRLLNSTPGAGEEKKELTEQELAAMKEEMTRKFYRDAIDYITDTVDLNALTKNTNYALQADGIYAIIKNRIGKFILKSAQADLPGLPKQFAAEAKIYLDVPKIPGDIYFQIKQFFQDIMEDMGNSEAFVQIYYDLEEKRYIAHAPEQKVSGASVSYDPSENLSVKDFDRYILVCEIHSHNTMGAFWSGTDDGDEKETRFYGVFGELNKPEHAEKFRTNVLGKYIDLKKEHIFDFAPNKVSKAYIASLLAEDETEIDPEKLIEALRKRPATVYPEDWKKNVSKHWGGYTGTTNYSHTGGTAGRHWGGYGNDTGFDDEWDPATWGNGHSQNKKGPKQWTNGTGMPGGNWSGGLPTNYQNLSKKEKKNSENFKSNDKNVGTSSTKSWESDWKSDYDEYWGSSQADGLVDAEAIAMDKYITQEIEERFNCDTIEAGYEELAIQEFTRTLDPNHINDLIDNLVEYGFQEEIYAYFGVEAVEEEDLPSNKKK